MLEDENYVKRKNNCRYAVYVFSLIIVVTFLFFQYLTGERAFLFPKMISDGMDQFYPTYVGMSQKMFNSLTHFSFHNGWGYGVTLTNPFDILIVCFGSEYVAYMIGIVTALRIIIAGIVFTIYLSEKGLEQLTCMAFGICYAFSLQVIGGGCWKTQAELAIIVALYLLAIERIKKKKGIIVTIVALLLTHLCLNVYYELTLVAFLCLYIGSELIIEKKSIFKNLSKKKIAIFLCACIFLISIGIWILAPSLSSIFESYRFKTGISSIDSAWKKTLSFTNVKIIATTCLRTLSPNILGIPGVNTYYGGEFGWYIGDGGYYCGVLSVLVLPQVFKKENKRVNIVYALGLIGCGLIVTCPVIRLITNGFADQVFKLTRIWITLIIILASARAFDDIIKNKEKLNIVKLYITGGLVVGTLFLILISPYRSKIYCFDVCGIVVFSSCVIILLSFWKKGAIDKKKFGFALLLLVLIEAIMMNYNFLNNDDALTKKDFESKYYNDGTKEVIDNNLALDDGFYRLDKNYKSVFLDDGKVQGYNGTSYYVGGVVNQNWTDFIVNLGIPTLYNQRGYCVGTSGKTELSTLMGVKYGLAKESIYSNYGYDLLVDEDKIDTYQNTNNLSIGFGYDKVIAQDEFVKIPLQDRDECLMQAVVIDDDISRENIPYLKSNEFQLKSAKVLSNQVIENYTFGDMILLNEVEENQTVVIDFENEEESSFQVLWLIDGVWDTNYQFGSIYEENGTCQIEISNQKGLQALVIYPYSTKQLTEIDRVSVSVYNSDEYYQYYSQCVEELKQNELQVLEYTDDYIKGEISVEKDELLYISIPYDTKFVYYVDGERVETYRANYAFTGIYVESGKHVVEMLYDK